MKSGFILAGAVLIGGAMIPAAASLAATQGPILLAQDDQHKDQHPQGGEHAGTGGGHAQPQGHMGSPMTGHPNAMSGHNTMTGHPNTMSGHTMMGGHPMSGGAAHGNFDRHTYQRNFTAPHHYHVGGYERPHGWYQHNWVYGEVLPALFWSQNYWLLDYYDYGLAVPPPGFVWVRYGNDALLIDQSTGEILQVEYGVFY